MERNVYLNRSFGDDSDIKLSYEDYLEMLENLIDDRLTKEGLFRFKNLWATNFREIIKVPIYSIIPTLILNRLILGPVNRGKVDHRLKFALSTITLPLCCWYFYTRPLPCRLYTEILADNGRDGKYVRNVLKNTKPGLWNNISLQMKELGYDFPEMANYSKATEFPKAVMN